MSYQVLARKWRPRRFDEVIGQEHVVRSLSNALASGRVHHAFLFTGTRGVGKTTIARILARCLNCEQGVGPTPCGECAACRGIDEGRFPDLIEVDAASRAKVEETRDLMGGVLYAPSQGRFKVYLIDEVHMFTGHSFNALLKTLEEPPAHVKFLLATTDPQKLLPTVLSRCLQFNLRSVAPELIALQLQRILEAESIGFEDSALRLIARSAEGSLRDALSVLDQAIAYGGGAVTERETRVLLGSVERHRVAALIDALAEGDAAALLEGVNALGTQSPDYDGALAELLSMLQRLAVLQAVPEAEIEGDGLEERLRALAGAVAPEEVQLWYQIGVAGRRDLPFAPSPREGFEMTVLRMLAFTPAAGAPEAPGAAAAGGGARARPSRAPAGAPGAAGAEAGPVAPAGPRDAPGGLDAERWLALVQSLELTGLARELAAHCAFVACADERLRLHLSAAHAPLNTEVARSRLLEALRQRLGENLGLEIELAETEGATPATRRREHLESQRENAVRALEAHPQVQALCEVLGTRVEPSRVHLKSD